MASKKFSVTLDTSEWLRSTRELEASFDRLQNKLKGSISSDNLAQPIREATAETKVLSETLQRAGSVAAGIFAVSGIQDFVQRLVSVRGEFQQLEIAFSTMLGSGQEAQQLLDQLTHTAATTPFDLQGISESAKQLLAYGFAADQVNDTIVRLGNVAAGLSQPLGDIVYLYGTLRASGRVTNIDIRQFANRGIPIYEELAKVLGKSTSEINGLVAAGKVGFPEIEQAFNNLTNQGGKFYNLMEAQSKSLSGQISNLGDNIDMMFNEIGKSSEGVLSSAISGVAFLVENYQKVGRAIVALVASYGAYRAAVIVNIALTRGWAVAARTDAIAKGVQTLATNATTLATKRLTAALMANPYGAIAVALTTVISLMWAFSESTDAAKKAQEDYDAEKEEAIRKEEEHKREIEQLLSVVQDESAGTDQRKDALARLAAYYPTIFAQYDGEISKLGNILELKQKIAQADGKAKLEDARKGADEAKKALEQAQKNYDNAVRQSTNGYFIDRRLEELNKAKEAYRLRSRDVRQLTDAQWLSAEGISKLNDSELKRLINSAGQGKNRANDKALQLVGSMVQGNYTSKQWAEFYNLAVSEQKRRARSFKSYTDQVSEARKEEKKAAEALTAYNKQSADQLKARQNAERAKGNYSWDADEERKRLKTNLEEAKKARAELEKLSGDDSKTTKRSTPRANTRKTSESDPTRQVREAEEKRQQALRAEREQSRAIWDAELDLQSERIELMEDGFDKEMAQLDLQRKRRLAAIDNEAQQRIEKLQEVKKREWEATHDSKKEVYRAPELIEIDLADTDQRQLREGRDLADRAYAEGQKKLLDGLLEKYQSYEDKRLAIAEKYQRDREAIEASDLLTAQQRSSAMIELEKAQKDELKRLDGERYDEAQRTNELLTQIFIQGTERTATQLRTTINQTRELLSYLSSTPTAELTPKFGLSSEDLATIQGSPEKLKAITDALKSLQNELANESPWQAFATNLTQGIDLAKKSLQDYRKARAEALTASTDEERLKATQKAREAMSGVGLSVTKIGKSVADATPLVKELGQSLGSIFGNDEISRQIDNLAEAMSDLSGIASGVGRAMSGDILGGVTGILSSVGNIIARSAKLEKEVQEERLKALRALTSAQAEYNLALLKQNALYEKGTTIFGEDVYGKAMNSIKVARDAILKLRKEATFQNADQVGDLFGSLPWYKALTKRGGAKARDWLNNDQLRQLRGDFSKLLNVQVKTGSHKEGGVFGLFARRVDDFDSIGKLYPKLIQANGQLNLQLAETILKNHEFADGHKQVLEQAIEMQKVVEEATKQVSEYMRSIFGQLGNSITDSLVSALRRGEDATAAFTKSVSGVLDNFIKQMAYSAYLAPVFERAQKQVTEAMNNAGLNDTERFARIADTMRKMISDVKNAEGNVERLVSQADREAAKQGFDTRGTASDTRSATAKGIAQASQDSIDTLSGLWHTSVLLSERTANATERMASLLEAQRSGVSLPTTQDTGVDSLGVASAKMQIELEQISRNTALTAEAAESIRFLMSRVESDGLRLKK